MSEDDLFLTIAALNLDADVSDAAFEAMSDSDKSVDAAVGEVLYLADNGAVWPPADGEWRERLRQPVLHAVEEANAAGVKAERARIVALLEADAAEWAKTAGDLHASGDFEIEEVAALCVTILRGTVLAIKKAL